MSTLTASRERATLTILALVQFAHVMDFMVMMPLGPQLMRAFAIGPEAFSSLVASYGLSAGVFGIGATFVLDRFDRKWSLLVLFAGFALATLMCASAQSYHVLLLARILAGAFGGVTGSVVTAVVGDVVPRERRGAGMAFVMSAFSLAQIVGVPVGLWLAARSDWHAPFLGLAGVSILVGVAALYILPRVDAHLKDPNPLPAVGRFVAIVTEVNHLRSFALVVTLTMSGMIVVPFLATALVRNGGVAEESLSLVYLCAGIATLVCNNVIGHFGDRVGHVRMFDLNAVFAIIPVILVTNIGEWTLPLILTVTTLFIISMGARWTPSMALVTMSVENRLRGGFMSLNTALQSVAGAVASWLAGVIVVEGADGSILRFAWVGVASLACLGVATIIVRRIKIVDASATPRPPAPESGVAD
ncbi:MAG TPA: MFS transporter [Opitutaceae bacterium]